MLPYVTLLVQLLISKLDMYIPFGDFYVITVTAAYDNSIYLDCVLDIQ